MNCPSCQSVMSRVIETKWTPAGTRRRRECHKCGTRYTTIEAVITARHVEHKIEGHQK